MRDQDLAYPNITLSYLIQTVKDRIDQTQCRHVFMSKIAQHDKLMFDISKATKVLSQKQQESQELENHGPEQYDELILEIRELEENIQGYLIQIELVEDELERLRTKWPSIDEEINSDMTVCMSPRKERSTKQMVSQLDGPVLRTLLWGILESYSKSEVSVFEIF